MKRFFDWQMKFALILILLSMAFYGLHFLIFRDLHHIILYLIGDIAFLFLNVLIVTLVLERMLVYREKQVIMKKLNMVIGTFFSEVGTELMRKCIEFDCRSSEIGNELIVSKDWTEEEFSRVRRIIKSHESNIDCCHGDLDEVRKFLVGQRPFLLILMENPNLLEHESFTDVLWAVFHLTDELAQRKDLKKLPPTDYQHLAGDVKRVYQQLLIQWLEYMKHLKHDYPYLFSLAMRTNPFDVNASVEVKA